jgi:hypothetical protein
MNVEQIKNHPFFYGVDWSIIRQIDAPFVPRLRSITDTSYFPVEDLEQSDADNAAGADANDTSKDLAFLGFVLLPSLTFYSVDLLTDIPSNASPSPTERNLFVRPVYAAAGLPPWRPDCSDLRVPIIASHTYS